MEAARGLEDIMNDLLGFPVFMQGTRAKSIAESKTSSTPSLQSQLRLHQ